MDEVYCISGLVVDEVYCISDQGWMRFIVSVIIIIISRLQGSGASMYQWCGYVSVVRVCISGAGVDEVYCISDQGWMKFIVSVIRV